MNERFQKYARSCWLTVHRDSRGWYGTNGPQWMVEQMLSDGWIIKLTGEMELQPDDSIRHYFQIVGQSGDAT